MDLVHHNPPLKRADLAGAWLRVLVAVQLLVAATGARAQEPGVVELPGAVGLHALMAPVREAFQPLGFTQTWDPRTDTIRLRGQGGTLHFVPGSFTATWTANGGSTSGCEGPPRTAELPEAPRYLGGTLYGPVCALWQLAGVEWQVVHERPEGVEFAVVSPGPGAEGLGELRRVLVTIMSPQEAALVENLRGSVVKLQTSQGDIYLELFDEVTPITAGNFLELVSRGFYDGTTFHRVISNFMIQGGDPEGTGYGGPGFTIPDEADRGLKHERGSLSMAKTDQPNTAGSQFFICHRPCPHLDGVHTVFGRCVSGQEVVDAIQQGDRVIQARILKKSEAADQAVARALAARVPDR